MKKALVLVVLALTFNAAAQDYKGHYGIGLALGEPSGFSIKKFNNNNEAFQYTLGYSAVKGQEGIKGERKGKKRKGKGQRQTVRLRQF